MFIKGFILPVYRKLDNRIVYRFFNNKNTRGDLLHEENAQNLIRSFGWQDEFGRSSINNPVDFLLERKRGIQIGSMNDKVIIASSEVYTKEHIEKILTENFGIIFKGYRF
ncbi:MAG: hypothetical protein IKM97_03170 [Clostridia bacterium]|nr:hypothetical protein [Clostridia bacterium]